MKVLLTGGGTGGHITPLLAVAQKLKALDDTVEIIYVGERRSKFADMTAGQQLFDSQYQVFAGKFRRYHGESWLKRIFAVKTNLQNLRDLIFVGIGTVQSWFLLRRIKPDVILLKGGYVGVPIGLASRANYPMITHDSDALPGLANRLTGRWARFHATGMPAENYRYSPHSVKFVGVLVGSQYQPVTPALQTEYKQSLKLPADAHLLLVTGGSLGAQAINEAMVKITPKLLETDPLLRIVHITGRGKAGCYGDYKNDRLTVMELAADVYRYSGAADVIVTRAGANTLAEYGVQGKACIVVPNPWLTGGHQLANAKHLAEKAAVVVVEEPTLAQNQAAALQLAIEDLFHDGAKRQRLGAKFKDMTIPDAAEQLARLLLEIGNSKTSQPIVTATTGREGE